MASSMPIPQVEWELPHLHAALLFLRGQNGRSGEARQLQPEDFWSVEFYPFSEPGVPPVFAVVGQNRILICRPPTITKDGKETSGLDVIATIIDDEKNADNVACAWSKHPETDVPLLCVAGFTGKIKIFDIVEREWLRTMVGHGGDISDLAICPTNPHILASASADCTIRIWSLDPRHGAQPCVAVLEGYGHKDTVHTVSWHQNGRYLLSAGVDRMINLWTLPVFTEANTALSKPLQIHYPHFSTTDIHKGIIDCVMWYGDLIFSKSGNEENIILWTIDDFDSTLPPPGSMEAPTIPIPMKNTRSSFCTPSSKMIGYTTHLSFNIPSTNDIFFTRFAIYPGSKTKNPVLSFLNGDSKIFFWDLARLLSYRDTIAQFPSIGVSTTAPSSTSTETSSSTAEFVSRGHPFLKPFQSLKPKQGRPSKTHSPALSSTASLASDSVDAENKGNVNWVQSREDWNNKYDMSEAHTVLEAHKTVAVPGGAVPVKGGKILGRQMAWSGDGRWCVGVGSLASIVLLKRSEGRGEER